MTKKPSPARRRPSKARSQSAVAFTHLDKVYYPERGYTKRDLIEYYEKVADYILPYLKNRPTVLNRHPSGIAGPHFYQKNIEPKDVPGFMRRIAIKTKEGKIDHYVVCDNQETLLWLANYGAIELHPWGSRVGSLHKPDFFIMDLDPGGASFNDCITVALRVHELLDKVGVANYCKTSGKSGLHVYAPLRGKYEYEFVRGFGKLLGEIVHASLPKITTTEHRIAKRGKRVFLDYLRNGFGQTAVAPYSLRPTKDATVSSPLLWSEVKRGLDPKAFTIETIFKRLSRVGDIWGGVLGRGADLQRAEAKLEKMRVH